MTSERWEQVSRIFHAALARDEQERPALLAEACAGDEPLRREVESLLAQPASAAGILNAPAIVAAAQMVSDVGASVMIGRRLGVYQIQARLGSGGMGEVYRARDTKLGRDVAIKILPQPFASDRDRVTRFEREAKVLAALNHPHIAAIYGLEESDGVRALVLELMEGTTLSAHIERGPMPAKKALTIARHVADALEAAHEKGIVHRDLKPANIMITADGTVKVLDFGLAKTASGDDASSDLTNASTVAGTHEGTLLGTAAYMSPEQARGKAVDKRADIWAFGVILFEMFTGRRPFTGNTISDVLAAVLTREPELGMLPVAIPERMRDLVRRCLHKDAKQRVRDIGEARIAIDAVLDGDRQPSVDGAQPHTTRLWLRALPWAITAVVFIMAVWVMYRVDATSAGESGWQKYTQLTDRAGEESAPTIAPDGASIAYASRTSGSWDIYVQRVGGHNPILVAGDSERHESAPAFSPDSQRLAFHEEDADGGIFLVGATGESSRRLTNTGFHPAWSPDGRSIVYGMEAITNPFTRFRVSALWVVDVESGRLRKIDDGDAVQPAWSPSGERIAFWAATNGQRDLFTIAAAGGARVPVLQDVALDWSPSWAADGRSLYFASDRGGATNVWRIAVDDSTGRARGVPEPVTGGVHAAADLPSLSKDGSKLVFRSRLTVVNPMTVAFDPVAERLGAPTPLLARTGVLSPWAVSPDGEWLALTNLGEQREDLFISRTNGNDLRRLTDDVAPDRMPVWSPDGAELAFYSNRGGDFQIWTIRRDGSGLTQRTHAKSGNMVFPLWSPNGKRMVGSDPRSPDAIGFLWNLSDGWPSSEPLTGLTRAEGRLRPRDWSPDGRRLAGVVQDAAGISAEGIIAWYDLNAGTSTIVSHDRSSNVQWLPDSRRMVIVNDKGEVVILDADTKRRKVLPTGWPFQIANGSVTVAPDGRTLYFGAQKVESDIWMVER
jgi:Tol biopolymer transport system component/serine/threonine protein kinase